MRRCQRLGTAGISGAGPLPRRGRLHPASASSGYAGNLSTCALPTGTFSGGLLSIGKDVCELRQPAGAGAAAVRERPYGGAAFRARLTMVALRCTWLCACRCRVPTAALHLQATLTPELRVGTFHLARVFHRLMYISGDRDRGCATTARRVDLPHNCWVRVSHDGGL